MSLSAHRLSRILAVTAAAVAFVVPASANHSWGNYPWARTTATFTLALGDNVAGTWDSHLATISNDWNQSFPVQTVIRAGRAGDPKQCRPTLGRVEVCNAAYGQRGWLGIASIWSNGDHITQGTVKLNDTYFNMARYNTPEWRRMVACQEVGHTFGLDHQDENFSNPNLGTCMDYTNNVLGPPSNVAPNSHDYAQLGTIYTHLDSTTTVGSSSAATAPAGSGDTPGEWGRAVRFTADGRGRVFVRELGGNQRITTFVLWADERGRR